MFFSMYHCLKLIQHWVADSLQMIAWLIKLSEIEFFERKKNIFLKKKKKSIHSYSKRVEHRFYGVLLRRSDMNMHLKKISTL